MIVKSCFSCQHYRCDHCAAEIFGWPGIGEFCTSFVYEPGTDEAELENGA